MNGSPKGLALRPDDRQRITEAERDRAVRALRERYANGDLDAEEFNDRLNALFAAGSSRSAASRRGLPCGPIAAHPR